MLSLRIIVINLALSGIAVAVATTAFWLDRYVPFRLPLGLTILAWPPIAIGGLLIMWAVMTLARHSGATGAPGDPTKILVTVGPYALLRNPIYAGDILLLLGLAFLTNSPSMLLYTIFFMFGIDLVVRVVEEPAAARRFGDDYVQYTMNVPRWLPKLRS